LATEERLKPAAFGPLDLHQTDDAVLANGVVKLMRHGQCECFATLL
jgi:hypothetical protein